MLQKTGTVWWWDGGAVSTESIGSGDGGGYVSVVADSTTTHRMFGLGNANQSASYSDIEFGLHLMDNGTLEILESGNNRGNVGSYSVGDVLKVAVVSGVVKYYRNSTVIYTSLGTPSYPLYLDTSFYTPGSRLVGALLCAGSKCTSTPEYTSYYTFGGTLVGMRRANATAGNGQFRIVGDHLGSTTLIVDTASPPNVVQRQYHKPYGETAWQYTDTSTGGEILTNVGYTGQRTDEESTGLMFFNARMYDPALSAFASADTIIPDENDPATYNRYSYVLGNPLSLHDPTGHSPKLPTNPRRAPVTYNSMRQLTYKHMMTTIGAPGYGPGDSIFIGIRKLMHSDELRPDLRARDILTGLAIWGTMVNEDGPWDMKSYLGDQMGIDQAGTPETGTDPVYFHMPGTPENVRTEFNIFGNIWYGFVGSAAGIDAGVLLGAAAGVDIYYHGEPNQPDLVAVLLGIKLWELYHDHLQDLTDEVFDRYIQGMAKYATHTKPSNVD